MLEKYNMHARFAPETARGAPVSSEKLHQRVHRLLRTFFHDPMSGVLEHDDGHIRSDQLHLLRQHISQRFFSADHENGHRQFGLREFSKVFRRLLE